MNRYELYEAAVQAPHAQVRFLEAVHGGEPRVLGEDFCGPASLARVWVTRGEGRSAVAVDLDPEPLAHARQLLGDGGAVALRQSNVLEAQEPADVIAALNFGVCEWHERPALVDYLRHVRGRLQPGGVFVADLYGGVEAFTPGEREEDKQTAIGVVGYAWEQQRVNRLTRRVTNAIHFRLPSGEALRDAFRYHWRLWSIPELRDAMHDAGFEHTEVHTDYADAIDAAGNVYVRALEDAEGEVELEEDWIVYVVGRVPA